MSHDAPSCIGNHSRWKITSWGPLIKNGLGRLESTIISDWQIRTMRRDARNRIYSKPPPIISVLCRIDINVGIDVDGPFIHDDDLDALENNVDGQKQTH